MVWLCWVMSPVELGVVEGADVELGVGVAVGRAVTVGTWLGAQLKVCPVFAGANPTSGIFEAARNATMWDVGSQEHLSALANVEGWAPWEHGIQSFVPEQVTRPTHPPSVLRIWLVTVV